MKERVYITTDSSKQSIILNKIPVLHLFAKISYSVLAVAKSIAEPRNSNNQSLANSSTPFNRAFFIRSTRTPKENALGVLLSMVTCSGKGFALCCVPVIAVFEPVIRYRPFQSLETLIAVTLKQFTGVTKMFYKFLFIGSRLHITVYARNLAEAYSRLPLSQTKPILIARLPVKRGLYA